MPIHRAISITKDGPYVVSGLVPLLVETIGVDREGQSVRWVKGKSFPPAERAYSAVAAGRRRGRSATVPMLRLILMGLRRPAGRRLLSRPKFRTDRWISWRMRKHCAPMHVFVTPMGEFGIKWLRPTALRSENISSDRQGIALQVDL